MATVDPGMLGDVVIACADLVGRAGAKSFEIGYLHEDAPIHEAGWYATAFYLGTRLSADDHRSPTAAAIALSERLLRGATCRCGQAVALMDGVNGCRWRLMGKRWEPSCDVPPLKVSGRRGDPVALARAMGNRAERRKRGK